MRAKMRRPSIGNPAAVTVRLPAAVTVRLGTATSFTESSLPPAVFPNSRTYAVAPVPADHPNVTDEPVNVLPGIGVVSVAFIGLVPVAVFVESEYCHTPFMRDQSRA